MFVSLRLITLRPDSSAEAERIAAELQAAGAALPGAGASWARPSEPGVTLNAGQVVWRTEFSSERAAIDAPLSAVWDSAVAPLLAGTQATSVGYQVTRKGLRGSGPGIWRALVFRVAPNACPDAVAELEAGLLLMPDYVGTIRSWALSTVATCDGLKDFTHV